MAIVSKVRSGMEIGGSLITGLPKVWARTRCLDYFSTSALRFMSNFHTELPTPDSGPWCQRVQDAAWRGEPASP